MTKSDHQLSIDKTNMLLNIIYLHLNEENYTHTIRDICTEWAKIALKDDYEIL